MFLSLQSQNPTFLQLLSTIQRVAKHPCTILIEGETGVGKEVIASLLHEYSPRATMPFIKINCGAIPEALVESELFGYEGGAFTGAKKEGSPGLFEQADKGTILLDEIGELPPLMQVKLLRALQEREIRRVGGSWSKTVDVRVIASTNQDLASLVEKRLFRSDLFYRLQIVQLKIPPLRERREDIGTLIDFFLTMFTDTYGPHPKSLTPEALKALIQAEWLGNIRQLRNCIESLYATVENEIITFADLPDHIKSQYDLPKQEHTGLRQKLARYEKKLIEEAILQTKSIRQAANLLDLPHSTLLRRIEKLDIHADPQK